MTDTPVSLPPPEREREVGQNERWSLRGAISLAHAVLLATYPVARLHLCVDATSLHRARR
jgi:hypothetical protein